MKILFVYPKYPDTFWSFKHVLWFISKKAAFPPLGLLTVAAMLPNEWERINSLRDTRKSYLRYTRQDGTTKGSTPLSVIINLL